ncbi:MAG: ribonuclease P protein component [Actinomycetota bacterium]
MLPAASRVRRSDDFTAVLRSGRRAGRGPLVVHLLPGPLEGPAIPLPPRAGVVVGRAVGNAVIRNRTRRRLRNLVRNRLTTLPSSSMLVIRALPGAAELSSEQLAAHVDAGLRRLSRTSA